MVGKGQGGGKGIFNGYPLLLHAWVIYFKTLKSFLGCDLYTSN